MIEEKPLLLRTEKIAFPVPGGLVTGAFPDWADTEHFPRLAQNMEGFANTIGDINVLERVGQIDKVKDDKYGNPIYRITNGDSRQVMDNFADRWELPTGRDGLQMGDIHLNRYNATGGSGRVTINVNNGGDEFKVRFEEIGE